MAVTLSRNLRLRIDSNLTANARYNLDRLDLIGANFLSDTTDSLLIRSRTNITLEPESPDIDGSGTGGTVSIGTADHTVTDFTVYSSSINFFGGVGFLDTGAGGTKYLRLKYKSDLSGSTDLVSDRILNVDPQGADRNMLLGGDLSLPGGLTVSTGSLILTQSGNTSLTLPASGTVATLSGAETFTNKQFTDRLRLNNGTYNTDIRFANSGQTQALTFRMPPDYGSNNQFLRGDGAGNLSWADPVAGAGQYETNWVAADGATKVVTHGLGSTDLDVTIIDLDDGSLVGVNSIVTTTSNILTLMASEAPATSWRVIIQAN